MNDITRLLQAAVRGDAQSAEEFLPLIYQELRQLARAKMAREQPGHTLQPTALVHEAWMRLGNARFENRAHFFSAAAEAMRRILIDRARRKLAARHGGREEHMDVNDVEIAAPAKDDELLAVHEALDKLATQDPQKAELVKLRYFAGLSHQEAADSLGIGRRAADRLWALARAWLFQRLQEE